MLARGDGWIMFPWGVERCLSRSPRARVCMYIPTYIIVCTLRRMRTIGEDICSFLCSCTVYAHNHYPASLPALYRYTSPSPPRPSAHTAHSSYSLLLAESTAAPPTTDPFREKVPPVITTLPRGARV